MISERKLEQAEHALRESEDRSRDITEHKRGDEALLENEQFLQNVFDAIQDGISVLDRDLTVIKTNRWIENMYSHQMPLVGRKCYQVYQQRQSPCPWCPSLRTLHTGRTHTELVPYPSAENPTRWSELSTFPIKDEQGHVTGVIEYVKNITKRKRAEEELETYRNHLEHLVQERTRELEARTQELEAFNKAMVDREVRIIEMKEKVNRLCVELGRKPEYPPVWK